MSEQYILKESEVRLKLAKGRGLYSEVPLTSPETAIKTMSVLLKELDHEIACVVNLDNKLHPINYTIVGMGSSNTCPIPIASVLRSALLSGASSIMLLHNHPSGDVTPSREDIEVTHKLILASHLTETPLMDHIIVGGYTGEYYSIRSEHPEIDFSKTPDCVKKPEQPSVRHKRIGR